MPLEDYVEATILSEFAPAGGDPAVVERMFEVQAVIGRTYAIGHLGRHAHEGFDLCDRTHCQLYEPARLKTSRWAPQAAEAVRRTAPKCSGSMAHRRSRYITPTAAATRAAQPRYGAAPHGRIW